MNRNILLLNIILMVNLFACKPATESTEKEKLPVELVDRIQLEDLEGNAIPLSSLKGKMIFLNYWATWCRPCLAEMPDIEKAAKVLEKEDFVFLAASDEDVDKIKNFAARKQFKFKIVHSKASVFDLNISALPTTMVINKEGKIVYNEVGARDWASETTLNDLRKLAEE